MQLLSPKVFNVDDREGWEVRDTRDDCRSFYKPMIHDPLNGAVLWFSHYPKGYWKPDHRHNCAHGIYVIDGELQMGDTIYKPETFIWNPAGYPCGHGAAPGKECRFLFVANRPFDIEFLDQPAGGSEETHREDDRQKYDRQNNNQKSAHLQNDTQQKDNRCKVYQTQENQLQAYPVFGNESWIEKEEPIGCRFFEKPLMVDRETGMTVEYVRFPPDFERPAHRYSCAYGLYIIRGRLLTSFGVCVKGDFVWFPSKYVSERFRTDDEDCLALLISNRQYNVEML
ncbi:MAG: cupin domain-containing protein [Bilifractor sp.]